MNATGFRGMVVVLLLTCLSSMEIYVVATNSNPIRQLAVDREKTESGRPVEGWQFQPKSQLSNTNYSRTEKFSSKNVDPTERMATEVRNKRSPYNQQHRYSSRPKTTSMAGVHNQQQRTARGGLERNFLRFGRGGGGGGLKTNFLRFGRAGGGLDRNFLRFGRRINENGDVVATATDEDVDEAVDRRTLGHINQLLLGIKMALNEDEETRNLLGITKNHDDNDNDNDDDDDADSEDLNINVIDGVATADEQNSSTMSTTTTRMSKRGSLNNNFLRYGRRATVASSANNGKRGPLERNFLRFGKRSNGPAVDLTELRNEENSKDGGHLVTASKDQETIERPMVG